MSSPIKRERRPIIDEAQPDSRSCPLAAKEFNSLRHLLLNETLVQRVCVPKRELLWAEKNKSGS